MLGAVVVPMEDDDEDWFRNIRVLMVQDLLLERSSNTLKSIAELDAKELQRHRQNGLLWQARVQHHCGWLQKELPT